MAKWQPSIKSQIALNTVTVTFSFAFRPTFELPFMWHYPFCSRAVTVMVPSFLTNRFGQTVLKEQSDQDRHCLQFHLHLLDALLYGKATLFKCYGDYRKFLGVQIFRIFVILFERNSINDICIHEMVKERVLCQLNHVNLNGLYKVYTCGLSLFQGKCPCLNLHVM